MWMKNEEIMKKSKENRWGKFLKKRESTGKESEWREHEEIMRKWGKWGDGE